MKTYREQLESLPNGWREAALEAAEKQNWFVVEPSDPCEKIYSAIDLCFSWYTTKEKQHWADVFNALYDNQPVPPYPFETKQPVNMRKDNKFKAKTYREHLESLPDGWREAALFEAEKQKWCNNSPDTQTDTTHRALFVSIDFDNTEEGYGFWIPLYEALYYGTEIPKYEKHEKNSFDTLCAGLNESARRIHNGNREKGFWDEQREVGTLLMLVVTELSEALEAFRSGKLANLEAFEKESTGKEFTERFKEHIKDTVEDEIADAVIRLLDFCAATGIDIERHIALKVAYNATRPHKHGKAF
jgi:NTP pyrophosphatase (non-canonical NTP hydrolase)